MMQRIVGFALRYRAAVLVAGILLVIGGLLAFRQLPIEAYPNPVPPMVEVIAQPPGWSAEESERYVTIPLEIGLSGMPQLDHIRSQSLFGLVDVKCYFKWGIDYKDARQEVINRLQFSQLPTGIVAQISPWNAIGEIFRYRLVDHELETKLAEIQRTIKDPVELAKRIDEAREASLLKLKTLEDWVLERQWKQVPGVVDVTSFGGLTKQYHVEVDPSRLKARNATLSQLTLAIANANQNVGGQRLEMGEQVYTVRGVGLIGAAADPATFDVVARQDIGEIVILEQNGVPVRVRDVADIRVGWTPRLGVVGKDEDDDIVQGIVLMRYGEQTQRTLDAVKERLAYIRKFVLPPQQGVEIVPYYDRGSLTNVTTHTVLENLLVGMGLVVVVLVLFLGNLRGALVTALNIPLALLVAFIGMVAIGASANLISLGAVDFGIVVDSTVIMMENIFRHLGAHGKGTIRERVYASAGEVGRPMAFSTLIIGVAFLPLFTMTGVSGVIFSPMARTYAFAIGGAVVMALTLTPAVTTWVLPPNSEEKESLAMRILHRIYKPLFDAALRFPRTAVMFALAPIVLCVGLFGLLGGEFMPKLEEGNFWIRATLPMSISMSESATYTNRMRAILKHHPEVLSVVSQLGRPDDGTDVAGFNNIELFAPLKPFDEWPNGLTKEKLTDELTHELAEAYPGVVFNFSQYLSDNVEEALSGVKGENSVKVYGPDIAKNEAAAESILETMDKVRGVEDLGLFHSMGQPSLKIVPDRIALARYGLNTGDVEAVIAATIGGQAITQVLDGEKSFDLTVRWKALYRSSPAAIRQILIASPDGSQIPARADRGGHRRVEPCRDLPRGRPALRTGEVLGAWTRPAIHRHRRTTTGRTTGTTAAGEPSRVERPDQRAQRGHRPSPADHSDNPAPDRVPHVQRGTQRDRYCDRADQHSARVRWWVASVGRYRRALLGIGCNGIHLDLRHRDPGVDPCRDVRATPVGRGQVSRGRSAQRGRAAVQAGAHDDARCDSRAVTCSALPRDRITDSEAARDRRDRRLADARDPYPGFAATTPRCRARPIQAQIDRSADLD